jgi:hypothetical protein
VADASAEDLDLLRGTLDVLVLKTLSWGPRHGYAIARWVHDISGDVLRVEEGALYPALHRLEKRGWIEAEWGLSESTPPPSPGSSPSISHAAAMDRAPHPGAAPLLPPAGRGA